MMTLLIGEIMFHEYMITDKHLIE